MRRVTGHWDSLHPEDMGLGFPGVLSLNPASDLKKKLQARILNPKRKTQNPTIMGHWAPDYFGLPKDGSLAERVASLGFA